MKTILTILALILSNVAQSQVLVYYKTYRNVSITRTVECYCDGLTVSEAKNGMSQLYDNLKFFSKDDADSYINFIGVMKQLGHYDSTASDNLVRIVEDTNWWFNRKYWSNNGN